jgi:hypothetical protein
MDNAYYLSYLEKEARKKAQTFQINPFTGQNLD